MPGPIAVDQKAIAERLIGAMLERRSPPRDQVRYELAWRGSAVTIVARRAPWHPQDREWSSQPIARLVHSTSGWTLDWMRASGRWERCNRDWPPAPLPRLLDEVDRDPHGCFWG
ncbi:MAG: DUF3024 domain-containing protein [Chloroflexi bacterium]|nr:DUF3024 domain-containing protein [Chloroflexota bacterium]